MLQHLREDNGDLPAGVPFSAKRRLPSRCRLMTSEAARIMFRLPARARLQTTSLRVGRQHRSSWLYGSS